MPDVKISELPQRAPQTTDLLPLIDSQATQTFKATAGAIAALGGGPPAAHQHGQITNAGAIGTAANLPVITGASGVLQVGAFGTAANTFCQGDDARLSNPRTPTAHASTHASTGVDAVPLIIPAAISLTTNQNDWTPNGGDGDIIKFGAAGAFNITGLSASMKAKAILLVNTGATNTVTLVHESPSSAAANQFTMPGGTNIALAPGQSIPVWYDTDTSKWRVIA